MDEYKKMYLTLLEPFQEELWSHKLTSAPIIVGKKYKDSPFRLMFVGRAVNGWNVDWYESSLEELVNQVFSHGFDMENVCNHSIQSNGYNFNRSPFWQLCKKLLTMMGESFEWSSRVAWSNLFKVAPFKKGNPGSKIVTLSTKSCIELIKKEIEIYAPSHIVFVTDSWWMEPSDYTSFSFAKELGVKLIPNSNNAIVGHGIYNNAKIVVTKRPETVKISRKEHAQQIIDVFEFL